MLLQRFWQKKSIAGGGSREWTVDSSDHIIICYFKDRHIWPKQASIHFVQVLTEGRVIPPVMDVQVQLLRRCQSSTVTKPKDWRTVIQTRDTGDDTRGHAKLAHQRGESTLQAISCSVPSMNWKSHAGHPLGCKQADHISQMERIGERGDLRTFLVFQLKKDSRAAEISILADFTVLAGLRTFSRPLLWPLGQSAWQVNCSYVWLMKDFGTMN